MNKKSINWIEISKKYKGRWIALDKDETRVVSASTEAKTAYKTAQDKGVETPILFRVPEEAVNYVG